MSVFVAYSSGNAAEDNTRLARAVTLAKLWGDGATIYLDTVRSKGTYHYTTAHYLAQNAINLDATPSTRLIRNNSNASIMWGTSNGTVLNPWDMTTGNVNATTSGASQIDAPAITLADGDWVLLYSDNTPSDYTPHSLSPNRPMRVCELHQVNRRLIAGTPGVNTTSWMLQKPTYDTMNSGQKIAKLPVIYGVKISNLQIEMLPGQTPAGSALALIGCIDFEMTDIRLGDKQGKCNPGEISTIYCKGRQVRCKCADHENPNVSQDSYYGFVDSICSQMVRVECEFGSLRHGFTTGGRERTVDGTTYRYGGALDGVFDNCTWYGAPQQRTSDSAFLSAPQWSDHSECSRYTVKNSRFYLPYWNAAFNIRGRDITFINNEIISATSGNVGYVRAARFSFINNRIKGGFRIEVSNGGTQANVDDVVFRGNTWRDTYGCVLAIFTGNNIDISDNHFFKCGAGVAGSPFSPKCIIYIRSLTDSNAKIRINGNTAPKYNNDYFVYTSGLGESQLASFSGNKGLETYTRCGLGFARHRIAIGGVYDPTDTTPSNYVGGIGQPIAAVPQWEIKYAVANGRDKFKYVKKQAHGLTAADVDCPITTGCQVYDHTLPDQVLDGWLGEVMNEDWFILFPSQSTFEVDDTILGETYSPETQTRALWWNGTTRKLMATPPNDNALDARTIVRVNAMDSGKIHLTFDYLPDSAISGGGGGSTLRVLGTNMADNVYYLPARPLVNQAKWIAPFVVGTASTWDTGGSVSVDANGFPTGFGSPTICNTVLMMYGGHANGTWTLTWDGPNNAITVDGATNNATSCVLTKNQTDQTFIVRLRASGITAIRCTHSSDNIGQTFHPAFVTKCQKYQLLRLMNWCNPNYIGWTPNWATRKTLNAYTNARASTTVLGVPQQIYEMPWEYCYQLGNATSRDIWICFHHLASDSYIQSACQLIHAGLAPGLKVYVEFSNETWNSAFPSRQWCIDNGDGTDTDPVRRGFICNMDRAAAIGNIAKANMPGRTVRTVMGVQSSGGVAFWDYAASKIKPASLAAIDVISPAPYFGNYVASTNTLRDAIVTGWNTSQAAAKDVIFSQIRTHLDDAVDGPYAQMTQWKAKCDSLGKMLIAYEGGQHLALRGVDYASYAANLGQAMILANRDSRMGDIYEEYLEQWYLRSGGAIMCHYTDVFTPQQLYGSWGAQEYEGESTSTAFKYAAILAHTGQTA